MARLIALVDHRVSPRLTSSPSIDSVLRVQAELEKLLILQDRDQKIRQIGIEIRTLPQQRKNLEAQLAAAAASLESLKQRARQLAANRKNLGLDVGPRQASISRLKSHQYETRTTDEFQSQ